MEVFVINLDRSPERLAHMRATLGGLGLGFTRVSAVDGHALGEAKWSKWAPAVTLRPGEIGCFLSHRLCWERIAQGGAHHAVVLEDDVHLGASSSAFLADDKWVPVDADLIKLETRLGQRTVVDQKTIAVGDRALARLRGANLCTGGYVVTRAGAAKLLDASRVLAMPVDNFMFDPRSEVFRRLVTYQLIPALCVQDADLTSDRRSAALGSTLETERMPRRLPLLLKMLREVSRPLGQVREAAENYFSARSRITIPFQ